MARSSIRLWFCLAVAAIAAAIADPIVEFASNAGWFGCGNFTDHSNLNVLPALLVGLVFVALHLVLKAWGTLSDQNRRSQVSLLRRSGQMLDCGVFRLVPVTFIIQMLILYVMETTEQVFVWHHSLGGTIWLGGPVLVSLGMHAAVCTLVAFAVARCVRTLARSTLRIIRFIRALATLPIRSLEPIIRRRWNVVTFHQFGPVLCGIRERAPPPLSA